MAAATTNPSKSTLLIHASITLKLFRASHRAWKRQATSLLSGIQVIGILMEPHLLNLPPLSLLVSQPKIQNTQIGSLLTNSSSIFFSPL
jgi:hypothetical protein